ncbi:sensor histidine kinase [Agromyces intestinalis]|uniref:histidine kinase n=1 Tax=Agromyces intestinalis TaxID=2592652 RepID=A0A5C1YFL5_9MICO|nr:sensor histidine kinase [Agromyces intestinalis]QEO13797.1 sensor histidine kinase [Agromyces intestinalis]
MSAVRSLWNAPAAVPSPPRRVWRDWVLVAIVPVLALVEASARPELPWRWVWGILLAALAATLLWRRQRPFTMLAIAFGTTTVTGLIVGGEPESFTAVYFLVLLYALLRWGSGRAMVGGGALVIAGTALSFLRAPNEVGDLIGAIAVIVTTCSIALAVRWRAAARVRELDRARLLERERLARDLHDTVAHHVSAIAIQAQAGGAVAAADPARAAEVLAVIEGEASRTLDEMRSMVRMLRRDDGRADAPELAPAPDLDAVRALENGAAAPPVHVHVDDDPDRTADVSSAPLPPAVAATVFRIAQEGVTNARRHAAGATRVDVLVRIDDDGVRLDVRDDGRSAPTASPGYGIAGMLERAALVGGTCSTGPAPGGGWVVTAVLPRSGWADRGQEDA